MFWKDKFIEYVLNENKRLTDRICSIYQERIERMDKDSEGRKKLAILCNRANVATPSEIEKVISDYLKIEWDSKDR